MGYLDFEKEDVINLQQSLKREYLRTNRAGSYASSTIVNCNTRKYHGLLVCPLTEFQGEKFVMLSNLHETIEQHGSEFNLGIAKYPKEFHPMGHKYITRFLSDPTPTIEYRIGGVHLKKQMLLVEEDERILITYTLLDAHSPTILKLRPFLAFRNVHELTHANMAAITRPEHCTSGMKHKMYDGFPYLYMQLSKKHEFVTAPDWYYNIEYEKEKERGFAYHEDLLVPGFFEMEIKKGESIVFSAGLSDTNYKNLKELFDSELSKRIPRNNYENCLDNSAQQFISKKGKKTEIIASFPWYGNWGRDSLVALPGLLLASGDFKTSKAVLNTISEDIDGYVYRNIGNAEHSNVDSIDTPLWFFSAIQQYAYATGDFTGVEKDYGKKLLEIITIYKKGQNKNVIMHDNGLLYLPDPNKALTWMDSCVDGKPIVPRYGYVVEINALWYNALCFLVELGKKTKKLNYSEETTPIIDAIEDSFKRVFWNSTKNYLADFVVGSKQDMSVRPNQIFAVSLPYTILSEHKKYQILEIIEKELLTPRGLRSLSPKDPMYIGNSQGFLRDRHMSYHRGSVWPWLLAPFAEGYLQIHQKSGLRLIKKIYQDFEQEMLNHGLGSISEIYDGNPPYEPRGSISQAWSVAALLWIRKLIKDNEEKG